MDDLAVGTWHIVETSLPLWRTRHDPTVTYAALPDGSLIDVVAFRSGRGASRRIIGIDRRSPDGGWRWRGVGPITRLAHSDWRFIAGDAAEGWAVTAFARTPFTSAGIDLYFRERQPADELLAAARRAASDDPQSRRRAAQLFRTRS
jgi:hypothetical protein